MAVEIRINGEVVTAYITGEIDHHTAASVRETIDSAIELNMPTLLVLDFGGVSFMDSSGIGLVMGRYRNMAKIRGSVHISSASPSLTKVFKLAGIEKLAKEKAEGPIFIFGSLYLASYIKNIDSTP